MKANMGLLDRVFRVVVAAGISYAYFTGRIEGPFGLGLMALAVIFVLTSLIGFCPLYAPFGLSTRRKGAA